MSAFFKACQLEALPGTTAQLQILVTVIIPVHRATCASPDQGEGAKHRSPSHNSPLGPLACLETSETPVKETLLHHPVTNTFYSDTAMEDEI